MKKIILNITILASMVFMLNSCVKDKFDGPENACLIETPEGTAITIEDMITNYVGLVTEDVYIEGTVVSSDEAGNFYKSVVLQDKTAGTKIHINGYSLFSIYPMSRNFYISLKGLYVGNGEIGNGLDDFGSPTRLTLAETENYMFNGACNQTISIDTVTLVDLNSSHINRLITVLGVEFKDAASPISYADTVNLITSNLILTDCSSEIIVRNSGYAEFAGDTVASGNGTITGVFSVFNSDKQLFIRDTKDVVMNDSRCDGQTTGGGGGGGGGGSANNYLYKDFDDNSLTSGGWTTFLESGTVDWELGSFNSFFYANISNYNGTGNDATEAWFISPSIDLSATTDPVLNFRNAYKYNGDELELFVSTDYNSGNPTAATWTDITSDAIWSPGDFTWVDSDDILLTAYKVANVHIGFKYTGSSSDGSNWEIDEIEIKEL